MYWKSWSESEISESKLSWEGIQGGPLTIAFTPRSTNLMCLFLGEGEGGGTQYLLELERVLETMATITNCLQDKLYLNNFKN